MSEVAMPTREELSVRELGQKVMKVVGLEPINRHTMRKLEVLVDDHAIAARRRGIAMPDFAILPLRLHGHVQLIRRDYGERELQVIVWNLLHQFPDMGEEEIAFGLQHAFPGAGWEKKLALSIPKIRKRMA